MSKKTFLSALMGVVAFVSSESWAACTTPPLQIPVATIPTLTDPIRNITGAVLSLLSLGEEPVQMAEVNVKQQEVDALADGDTSYRVNEGKGEAASGLEITAYDYLKEKVLDGNYTPYAPLNSKINGGEGDTKQAILDLFFVPDEKTATQEQVDRIEKNRADYLKTISDSYVRLAYETQQKLIDDMDAVTAEISGNGTIGVISGIDQTWRAVNKALIADIALQIEAMELDAAKFLSYQPLIVMDENPPAELTSENAEVGTTWTGGGSRYAVESKADKE